MKGPGGIGRFFRLLASLRLAVGLLALDAAVLAWATLVESRDGAAAAHFGIYDTGWFLALNVALAVNILGALWVRLPWKRHWGFAVVHLGILLLLAGCLITRLDGIEAQLPIFEGQAAHRAYTGGRHFELRVTANKPADKVGSGANPSVAGGANLGQVIHIPFIAGPFPWAAYARRSWFPWRLARRTQGRIYDRDGLVLEALGYTDDPEPSARVRLTVDGKAQEFDLLEAESEPPADQPHAVKSGQRSVSITLRPNEIDLGFQVYLRRFRRKLDPGSGMPSHYSSLVDLLDRGDPPRPLFQNVLITLNAPVDVADPISGRSWRLFQASFNGPWKPGDPEFDQLAGRDPHRSQIYLSQLSANYDPGRGAKYFGCLMIVAGMMIVYGLSRRSAPPGTLQRGTEHHSRQHTPDSGSPPAALVARPCR